MIYRNNRNSSVPECQNIVPVDVEPIPYFSRTRKSTPKKTIKNRGKKQLYARSRRAGEIVENYTFFNFKTRRSNCHQNIPIAIEQKAGKEKHFVSKHVELSFSKQFALIFSQSTEPEI